MDAMHVVLGLAAAGGVAAAVWLLVQRAGLVARLSGVEGERAAREADLAKAESARAEAERRVGELAREASGLAARLEQIEAERKRGEEQLKALKEEFRAVFDQLAAAALSKSTGDLLRMAEEKLGAKTAEADAETDRRRVQIEGLVEPIRRVLSETDQKLGAMEQERGKAYATLVEQVRAMQSEGALLRGETGKLVKALREPQVRGRYGEIQLRRVAELAGMRPYCDFAEQEQTMGEDGRARRPDMIVKLPNDRELVVDAKTNTKPYMDAMEADDPDVAEERLGRFADGVAEQAEKLARKGYYSEYAGSPDFVVMFLPGDGFLDAALSRRPDLLEFAASRNVILASPASLIAMLRAVAVGFQEQKLSEAARTLRGMVVELHQRLGVMMEHADDLGRHLGQMVGKWNSLVGSYESRVEPQVRAIEEAGVKSAREVPALKAQTVPVRALEVRMPGAGETN